MKESKDNSSFRYTFNKGLHSTVRISKIVLKTLWLNLSDVHWFVMCDDDIVSFLENMLQVPSKYDHSQFYYIGANSNNVKQNILLFYGMDFGGGSIAISYPLAKVLEKMQDNCLDWYFLWSYERHFKSDFTIKYIPAKLFTNYPFYWTIRIRSGFENQRWETINIYGVNSL